MIRRLNRLIIATPNLDAAGARVRQTLALPPGRRYAVPDIGAVTEELPFGDGILQLLTPAGEGPVERFLRQHGGGIYGVGVETSSLADSRLRVEQSGRQAHPLHLEGRELVCLKREQLPGMTVWFDEPGMAPSPGSGIVISEITCLVEDHAAAAETYKRVFGPPAHIHRFENEDYGYAATVLFYGKRRLPGRVELAQVTRPETAMGRFWAKHGVSAYMATLEVEDFAGFLAALDERGVRYSREPRSPQTTAYIHPSMLAGCFLGIVAAPGMQVP